MYIKNLNMEHKCTLTSLYPDADIRMIIYENLSEVFEVKFENIIKEASSYIPYLTCPARFYEEEIKNLFIEEGLEFSSVEDLEKVLNKLNYLKFAHYRKAKLSFEKSTGLTSKSSRAKRVAFYI